MKIDVYEVPVALKRVNGVVQVTVLEEQRKWIRSESLEVQSTNMIPNIAKELADHNDKQRLMVKNMLLSRPERPGEQEQEANAKIELKYLS